MCPCFISDSFSRSDMVRLIFITRWYARGDKSMCLAAWFKTFLASDDKGANSSRSRKSISLFE